MEEADLLCDRIGFIDKGEIIAVNSPLKLKDDTGGEIINIQLKNYQISEKEKIVNTIKHFDFVHKIEAFEKKEKITVYVDNASHNLPIILKNIDKGNEHTNITAVNYRSPTLNDVFLKFTGRGITDQHNKDSAEGGFMERYAQYGKK